MAQGRCRAMQRPRSQITSHRCYAALNVSWRTTSRALKFSFFDVEKSNLEWYQLWRGKSSARSTADTHPKSSCYGLLCCWRSELSWVPVLNLRAKLIKTNNIDVVNYCRMQFNFDLPNVAMAQRKNLLTSIGCVTMLFVSHLYLVNMCQWCSLLYHFSLVSNYC